MKREILFRGKSDNYGWVNGYFLDNHEGECFIQNIDIHGKCMINVIPDSVGQFTGITDKNGVKIFEGDIVKDWADTRAIKFEIYDNYQGYDLEPDDIDCEVIGNIHDNPELI